MIVNPLEALEKYGVVMPYPVRLEGNNLTIEAIRETLTATASYSDALEYDARKSEESIAKKDFSLEQSKNDENLSEIVYLSKAALENLNAVTRSTGIRVSYVHRGI